MTAIVLAAGVGRRMGPGAGPKCLLSVGGKTLLQRMLEGLRSVGVGEVVLVVGFQRERVAEEARRQAGRMRLHILENPRYSEGAILSLWTARSFLDRPVLVMDADVLCPPRALERLLGSVHPNGLLADGSAVETGEEMMIFGRAGRALEITKSPSDEVRRGMTSYGESIGFLKLSAEAAGELRGCLEKRVERGIVRIEHEQVYPELFERVRVGCERVDGLPWIEMDTPEDLRRAKEEILPRWSAPRCVNGRLADFFLPAVVRLPLTPNQWTAVSLALGLGSVACMAQGSSGFLWLGAALFQAFYVVDYWDGAVARRKGLSSKSGAWFDLLSDAAVQAALPLGIGAGLKRTGAPGWTMGLAWAAFAGMALDFLVTFWGKCRGFGPAVYGDPARGSRDDSGSRVRRWLKANWTHENFSLGVAAVLLLDGRLPFLAAMALGSHIFWMRFLWRERARLAREWIPGVKRRTMRQAQP